MNGPTLTQYLNADGSISRRKVGLAIGSRTKQRRFQTKRHSFKGDRSLTDKRGALKVTEKIDQLIRGRPLRVAR
jgi:hypothetical protein